MLNKIVSTALLLTTLTACGINQQLSPNNIYPNYNQGYTSNAKKKIRANVDWYENLKPELKQYYADAKGKTGEALFDTLHEITGRGYRSDDYGSAKSFIYSTADNITVNGNKGILTAYSQIFVPGSSGNGDNYRERGDENKDGSSSDFINCEHTWPQSFFNKQLPMVSDLHHLQSTFSIPNNRRGHYPFGEVEGSVIYSTSSGSKLSGSAETSRRVSASDLKSIMNLPYLQRDNVIKSKNLGFVFEPTNVQKGNTARAMMYFFLRYHDRNIKSGEYNEQEFWDSKVKTFIKWAEQIDQVDANEARRNDIIFGKQGNRNPFVDIPGLASLIGEDVLTSK